MTKSHAERTEQIFQNHVRICRKCKVKAGASKTFLLCPKGMKYFNVHLEAESNKRVTDQRLEY